MSKLQSHDPSEITLKGWFGFWLA